MEDGIVMVIKIYSEIPDNSVGMWDHGWLNLIVAPTILFPLKVLDKRNYGQLLYPHV